MDGGVSKIKSEYGGNVAHLTAHNHTPYSGTAAHPFDFAEDDPVISHAAAAAATASSLAAYPFVPRRARSTAAASSSCAPIPARASNATDALCAVSDPIGIATALALHSPSHVCYNNIKAMSEMGFTVQTQTRLSIDAIIDKTKRNYALHIDFLLSRLIVLEVNKSVRDAFQKERIANTEASGGIPSPMHRWQEGRHVQEYSKLYACVCCPKFKPSQKAIGLAHMVSKHGLYIDTSSGEEPELDVPSAAIAAAGAECIGVVPAYLAELIAAAALTNKGELASQAHSAELRNTLVRTIQEMQEKLDKADVLLQAEKANSFELHRRLHIFENAERKVKQLNDNRRQVKPPSSSSSSSSMVHTHSAPPALGSARPPSPPLNSFNEMPSLECPVSSDVSIIISTAGDGAPKRSFQEMHGSAMSLGCEPTSSPKKKSNLASLQPKKE
jgi:hypothetical protein